MKKFLSSLIVILLFVLSTATSHAALTSGDVGQFFGEMFSASDDSISFKDFENAPITLDSDAGYSAELVASTDLRDYIVTIVNWALTFLGLISVLVIIYGGVLYVTSGGEEEQTGKGKKAIQYAVVGILIILGSFAFVNTIIKGATDSAPGSGVTGGAFSGGGFNASASEVKALAEELYDGYVFLEQATEDMKNIKNDVEKLSLSPDKYPSKAEVLQFLESVKEKLKNIENRSQDFSRTQVAVSDAIRIIDRDMLDIIGGLSDNTNYIDIHADGTDSVCPSTKEAIIEEPGSGDRESRDEQFLIGFAESAEDLTREELCIEVGYNINYTPGLYGSWTVIRKYFTGETALDTGKQDIYTEILDPIAMDYGIQLLRIFERLQRVYDELQTIEAVNQGVAGQDFNSMRDQYGFRSTVSVPASLPTESSKIKSLLTTSADDGLLSNVAGWKVDSDINVSGQHLLAGLQAHAGFYQALLDLEYVNARLSANVVEGTAPLTVIFDTAGTQDPSGGSISGDNIFWDIGGTQTTDQLFRYEFDSGVKSPDNIITDDAVTCMRSTESITPAGGNATEEDLVGNTAKRCTFHVPGTYTAAIKVNSNSPSQFAPGISVLVIKIRPPKTQIELSAGIGQGMEDSQVIMHYENEVLLIDKREVNFTFSKASEGDGVCFDATGTKGNKYQWNFGNQEQSDFSSGAVKECTKYREPGKYEVTLEVANALGDIDKKIFTINVSTIAARLKVTPATQANLGDAVTFDASGATSDLGSIRNYKWNIAIDPEASSNLYHELILEIQNEYSGFESANSGTNLVSLEHEFKYPGTYNVSVEVEDQSGQTDTETIKFKIISEPPVALFDHVVDDLAQPGTIHFNALKSYDPDNDEDRMKYYWSIEPDDDKGKKWECISEDCRDLGDFDDIDPIVKFKETGNYEVTLRVNSYGEEDTIKKTVSVNNVLDVAWAEDQDTTTQLGDDGQVQMEFFLVSDNAREYELEFGDGEMTSGQFPEGDNEVKVVHTYKRAGTMTVIAKVYDEDYNDNIIKRRVFIGDGENPIAKIALRVNGVEINDLEEAVRIAKTDILTLDGTGSKNIDGTIKNLGFSWDYGSGKSSSKSFTHSYDDLGMYSIVLEVFDRENPRLKSVDEILLNVISKPPRFSSITAVPDSRNSDMVTPVTVNTKAVGAKDDDGDIVQYKWWYYNVKDADEPLGIQITTTPNAVLTIGTSGKEGETNTYGFGLELTDSDNIKVSSMDTLSVDRIPTVEATNGPNTLPEAKFNVNATSVFAGEEVTFTSASSDEDGNIVSYVWDFEGDGFGNDQPTDSAQVQHAFTAKNLQGYNARLKVVDDKGGEAISNPITIYVDSIASPPRAAFTFEVLPGSAGKKVKFINNSTVDEEAGAEILSYRWDFDTSSVLSTADSDGDGFSDNDVDSQLENPQRLYTSNGVYTVGLTVTDNQGNVDYITKSLSIPMSNPPVAAFTYEVINGQVVFTNNSEADTQAGNFIEHYIWDFDTASALPTADTDGDGDKTNDEDSVSPNPTHTYTSPGVYDVTLIVIDNQGSEDSITRQVNTSGADTPPPADSGLTARLTSDPLPSVDGSVYLFGEKGSVTFDFSESDGAIAYYVLDKNIYFDTDGNGVPNDDEDFRTSLPGTWKTNFEKAWGQTVVKLTVNDIYGNTATATQEIKFQ